MNDENNRGQVVVQAVDSLFEIIDQGITDRKNAAHVKDIKESLNALEEGRFLMFELIISARKNSCNKKTLQISEYVT